MNNAGKEADRRALDQVAKFFQRPDQLEKLDVLRKKADGKRAAVEAMLRTGVHSQLEGIRAAMGHLTRASTDINDLEKSMNEVMQRLQTVTGLKQRMSKLSEANQMHSQYAAAMNNLKHIFNITESIERTHAHIADGELLLAHQNIMHLEEARDALMAEVHKVQSDSKEYDLSLLKNYFSEIDNLANELAKQLWFICEKALLAVNASSSCTQLVSALRIIMREERVDESFRRATEANPDTFIPPGRPRKWKRQLFDVLKRKVQQKIEGCQFEDRSINQQWLARYLEVLRNMLIEDLLLVKRAFNGIFPPELAIFDRYLKYYHDSVSSRIQEITETDLGRNEIVQLLSWIRGYGSEDVLGHPRLGITTAAFLADNPLITRETMDELLDKFLMLTKNDLNSWMQRTLGTEKDDWYKDVAPEEDGRGYYYTQMPSIVYAMIEDQIRLIKHVSQSAVPKLIDISVDELSVAANKYRDAANAYRTKHFENRRQFQRFTATMIATANNSDICTEHTDKLEKQLRLTMESSADGQPIIPEPPPGIRSPTGLPAVNRQELIARIEQLRKRWSAVMQASIQALLDEVYADTDKHIQALLTRSWFDSTEDHLGTICETIRDYNTDYNHLRPHIQLTLLKELLYKVVGEYVIAMEARRFTYSNHRERHAAAERIRDDMRRIDQLYAAFSDHEQTVFPQITSAVAAMVEVLDLADKSMLQLVVSSLVRKYPDMPAELLSAMLLSREDIGRNEAKTMADEALKHVRFHPKGDKEIVKLFAMNKSGRKAIPAVEEMVQNVYSSFLMATARNMAQGLAEQRDG